MHIKLVSGLIVTASLLVGLCNGNTVSYKHVSQPLLNYKNPNAIRKSLKKAHIIPDTLDDFIPSCSIHVVYTSYKEVVGLGNKIKPSHTKEAPIVQILCYDNQANEKIRNFTVALTDPDAPSRKDPEWSEMCHWIVVLPTIGNTLLTERFQANERLEDPKEIVEYKPPGPPSKTGYHRYVFVLLAGDNSNLTAPSERKHWGTGKERHGVRDWAEKEGLEVVSANFFYAHHEM